MNFQMNKLLKQAQEMQKKMQQAQEELTKMEVCGQSGGGIVKIWMNGQNQVTRIELLPTVREEELEVEADLILAAFNDASGKIREASKTKLGALTAGLELPEGLGGLGE